jgi:uncharacterized membrane protein
MLWWILGIAFVLELIGWTFESFDHVIGVIAFAALVCIFYLVNKVNNLEHYAESMKEEALRNLRK